MGCDIHLSVEKRNYEDTAWLNQDRWEINELYKGDKCLGQPDPEKASKAQLLECLHHSWRGSWFGDRNYDLFALLANVRNGTYESSFALTGIVDNMRTITPICEPRGLPDDMSPWTKLHLERSADHSHSWLLLSEVLAVDYDAPGAAENRGWVPLREYLRWKASSDHSPNHYCGMASGPGVRAWPEAQWLQLDEEQRQLAIAGEPECEGFLGGKTYIACAWKLTLREAIGPRWFKLMDELKYLHDDPTKVRLVFGFDS